MRPASHTQHLLPELCADAPAPRHGLFLAVVTVHYSHENRQPSPSLTVLGRRAQGARAAGALGSGPLAMDCLFSWVPAKASRDTGVQLPGMLREVHGLRYPGNGQVGTRAGPRNRHIGPHLVAVSADMEQSGEGCMTSVPLSRGLS